MEARHTVNWFTATVSSLQWILIRSKLDLNPTRKTKMLRLSAMVIMVASCFAEVLSSSFYNRRRDVLMNECLYSLNTYIQLL